TGQEHDGDLGLINMRGRIYDPRLGKLLQADPLVTDPFSSMGQNRYAYVMGNPMRYVDPSGFDPALPTSYEYERSNYGNNWDMVNQVPIGDQVNTISVVEHDETLPLYSSGYLY